MEYAIHPAIELSAPDLAGLFSTCFADYFVPLHISEATITAMQRRDSVDLARSCVVVRKGRPAGFMLLARRGDGARIAAMGVIPDARRAGLARRMVDLAIEESRAAGCTRLWLEVITANAPAVRLYESAAFGRVSTLLGYTFDAASAQAIATASASEPQASLVATEPRIVAEWIDRHGPTDLPWQLAAPTIANALPGHTAYLWPDRAACLITDATQERVALLSLVVARDQRRRGVGRAVLRELMRMHPNRIWRVPEIVPEGHNTAFLRAAGWQPSSIQQYLMKRKL